MINVLLRMMATLVLIVAGCAAGYELWNYYLLSPWTRDAKVRADVVTIAPDVTGFVTDLRVADNQFVHKGDVLFVIDQARYERAVALAKADLAARKAEMNMHQEEAERRAKLTNMAITP